MDNVKDSTDKDGEIDKHTSQKRKNIDPKDNNSKENILIEWYRGTNGIVEEISLKNAQEWSRPWKDGHGCWRVEATYLTAHVRGIPSKMKTMKSTHYVYIDPNDYKKLTSGGKSDVPVTTHRVGSYSSTLNKHPTS